MTSVTRGRPQASSRETLAEAASELFLEQGYDATTVADITQRAGVSRSTFFNYFDGKAATIWYALDASLAELSKNDEAPVMEQVASLLVAFPPHTLALAIANAEVMGVETELSTGRALRQAELADIVAKRHRESASHAGRDMLLAEIAGAAYAAATFGAIWRWAEWGAGTHRLDEVISEALTVLRTSGSVGVRGAHALRVAVIGAGAIGAKVIRDLVDGKIEGAELAGVLTKRDDALDEFTGLPVTDFGDDLGRAIAESDLIVECAGVASLTELGPKIVQAGRDLLIVSIGALADPAVRASLTAGPGRLLRSSGAIGGLDLLRAAGRPGGIPDGITAVSLTSTKRADTLIQPWMSDDEAANLRGLDAPITLFDGTVGEAIERFPASLNVACAIADATGLWERTRVRLVADPHAYRTTHEIEATGAAGEYRFSLANTVSLVNPTSSLVVAEAVLSEITSLAG